MASALQKTRHGSGAAPKKNQAPSTIKNVQTKGGVFTNTLANRARMKGKMGH